MTRSFNDDEKQFIYTALIDQGKELFSQFGFKKTSILEITKRTGIAQGTFYNFFASKEELYFVILEQEEKKLKEQLAQIEIFEEEQPKEVIKHILKKMIQMIEKNPLIRDLYFGSSMEKLTRKLSPDLLEEHFQKDSKSLLFFIQKLEAAGFVVEQESEVIAGVLRSLFILTLHQKEIGTKVYPQTIELFIDVIVDGIIKEERK